MAKVVPWNPADWLSDSEIARCSLPTRAIWLEWVQHMHLLGCASLEGTEHELSVLARSTVSDVGRALSEIRARPGIGSVTRTGSTVTVVSTRLFIPMERRRKQTERQRRKRDRDKEGLFVTPLSHRPVTPGPSPPVSPPTPPPSHPLPKSESVSTREGAGARGPAFPLHVAAGIATLYPKHRQSAPRAQAQAVQGALQRIADNDEHPGHADPVAWLQERVRAFAASAAGKAGRHVPGAVRWFDGDGFDAPPEAWRNADEFGSPDRSDSDQRRATKRAAEFDEGDGLRVTRVSGVARQQPPAAPEAPW